MTRTLEYATPDRINRWTLRLRAVVRFSWPGVLVAIVAGCSSTAAMLVFRQIEGRPTLAGPPHGHFYQACIALLPFLTVSALLPIAWGRAIYRSHPLDRLAIAFLMLVPLSGIWIGAVLWIFSNADRTFP